MHKEMNSALGLPALSQKNFRKQLVYDLVGDELMPQPGEDPPSPASAHYP